MIGYRAFALVCSAALSAQACTLVLPATLGGMASNHNRRAERAEAEARQAEVNAQHEALRGDKVPAEVTAPVAVATAAGADEPAAAPDLVTLRNGARDAARRGDCDSAASLVADAREVNPQYADRVLANDPVISRCGTTTPGPEAEPPAPEPGRRQSVAGRFVGGLVVGVAIDVALGRFLLTAAFSGDD